jgi:hypothetical protein
MPKLGGFKSTYGIDVKRRACQRCGDLTVNRFYCHNCWKGNPDYDSPRLTAKELAKVSSLIVDGAKFNPSVPRVYKKKIKVETEIDFTTKQDMLSEEDTSNPWELPNE